MSDTRQIEMRLHEIKSKLSSLDAELQRLDKKITQHSDDLKTVSGTLNNLCNRLMVQG